MAGTKPGAGRYVRARRRLVNASDATTPSPAQTLEQLLHLGDEARVARARDGELQHAGRGKLNAAESHQLAGVTLSVMTDAHADGRSEAKEAGVTPVKQRYVVDEDGNRMAVFLDLEEYRKILSELEELESIRAYDAAKVSGEEAILLAQAIAEIERDRG